MYSLFFYCIMYIASFIPDRLQLNLFQILSLVIQFTDALRFSYIANGVIEQEKSFPKLHISISVSHNYMYNVTNT